MQFESSRLTYQSLKESDWPFFLALSKDREVMKYVSDALSDQQIRETRFAIRLPEWRKGSAHWLCLTMREKETQAPVGFTGFIDRGDGVAEVGFLLARAFHGMGYGTESLNRIVSLAFDEYGFRKLQATVTAGNIASKRTLLKAGFIHEATLRESFCIDGRWLDDWLFSLPKADAPLSAASPEIPSR